MGIEENGSNLSGGEKQRIEIARALLKHPSILIIDEGTNLLDTATEQIIMQNIKQTDRTLVIIAHRLSAICNCDRILFLKKDRTNNLGTHEELLRNCPDYQLLIEAEQRE
jgi:ABC-type multidrug transport system fused ATPase/permease subunit